MKWRKSAVYPFIIVLKNNQLRAIRFTGLICLIIALTLFIWRGLLPLGSTMNFLFAGIIAVWLFWNIWEISQGKTTRFTPGFIATAIGMTLLPPHSFFALLYLILAWLEKQAIAATEIGFDDHQIVINGLWPKKIQWQELNHVILKDGLLTIDFKNNRLFQKETDDLDDDDYDGDEDSFNDYCRLQLQQHHKKPSK